MLRPGGRVVSIIGLSDHANDDISPIVERLNESLRPEHSESTVAIDVQGRAAGFDIEHEGAATTTKSVSPGELVTELEQRLFANLWDVPDDVWGRVVQPAIDELLALPNPDQRRHRVFDHPPIVFGKR